MDRRWVVEDFRLADPRRLAGLLCRSVEVGKSPPTTERRQARHTVDQLGPNTLHGRFQMTLSRSWHLDCCSGGAAPGTNYILRHSARTLRLKKSTPPLKSHLVSNRSVPFYNIANSITASAIMPKVHLLDTVAYVYTIVSCASSNSDTSQREYPVPGQRNRESRI